MQYDIQKIPFSRYGSYFAISRDEASDSVYIRDLHGGDEAPSNIYKLQLIDHKWEDVVLIRTETKLVWKSKKNKKNRISIVMGEGDVVHILTEGIAAILEAVGGKYDTLVPLSDKQYEHHLYGKQIKVMLTQVQGTVKIEQEWKVIGSQNVAIYLDKDHTHFVIESYKVVWKPHEYLSFIDTEKKSKESYEKWALQFVNPSGEYTQSYKLATYITWCNFVHKEGHLSGDAMYMSKNWMFNIWSWDNCFAGIALSTTNPRLAFDQLDIFIKNQDESGIYPDYVNETFASFNCVKPPIHAWAFRKMKQQNSFFKEKLVLERAYDSFCRVAKYWLDYRRDNVECLPLYYHGNDSGWDNASVFHKGFPVESPDLAAFLIQKIDILSEMAIELGKIEEAKKWKNTADYLFELFMKRFYVDGQFRAIYTPTEERITCGDSLLMYMPIVIGYRMSKKIVDQLVRDLIERFETPYGLATEAPSSEYYKQGGYWLGPIWAPTTYLLIDALRENGYEEMARRLAVKFCRLTVKGLMSENYDPFTGEGYDDPAFAWPSCVFLQLIKEYEDWEG